VELILPGTLDTNDSTEFRSNNPNAGRGSWYGIRLTSLSQIASLDSLLIADAGGAITLESADSATLPDLAVLGALRFEHNSSDLCLAREETCEMICSLAVLPTWLEGRSHSCSTCARRSWR
jgi:hypothetical protein